MVSKMRARQTVFVRNVPFDATADDLKEAGHGYDIPSRSHLVVSEMLVHPVSEEGFIAVGCLSQRSHKPGVQKIWQSELWP